jgi:hypothetical protein
LFFSILIFLCILMDQAQRLGARQKV